MRNKLLLVGICIFGTALAASPAAVAQSLVTINTEITSMPLSGTGSIPLGTGDVPPDYRFVESAVTATLSNDPNAKSMGTTNLAVTYSLVDPLADPFDLNSYSVTVVADSTFNFYFDLTFTDIDPNNNYAAGLASPFTLLADPAKPLIITLNDSVTFLLADILANPDVLPDDPGIMTASNVVSRPLGVDVNASGLNDFIKYEAASFDFGDDLSFDDAVSTNTNVDTLEELIVNLGTLFPLTIDAQISILSASFTFTGAVADDQTDPPFSIELFGPNVVLSSVPEPGTLALLAVALAGFSIFRRKTH